MLTLSMSINSSSKTIWAGYVNEEIRKKWETDLEYLKTENGFISGGKGVMKLKGMPELKFVLIDVILEKQYINQYTMCR